MNSEKVSVFLPCRKGSERVPQKNIKPFAHYPNGLIELKLRQLLEAKNIDEIYLSTNDNEILKYASRIGDSRLVLHKRSEELSSSQTSTDALVDHAVELIENSHILWTHVTSPFITAEKYDEIIKKYKQCLKEGYDSLMTTTLIYGFLWQDEKPLNYNRAIEKWPRTQTLKPIHEVNSGAFLASCNIYKTIKDRIGERPYLFELDKITSLDVDWPEDFKLADIIARNYTSPSY